MANLAKGTSWPIVAGLFFAGAFLAVSFGHNVIGALFGACGLLSGGIALVSLALELGANLGFRERLQNEIPRELLQEPPPALPEPAAPPVEIVGACPRCFAKLGDVVGDEQRCPAGHGSLVSASSTERLLERAGLEMSLVREVVREKGVPRAPCPACKATMSEAQLKGVVVDLCLGCGALWLDHGELAKLSREELFTS